MTSNRPTDEEFARHAARHSLHPKGKASRPERVEHLQNWGVKNEDTLAEHALKVIHDPETKCFVGEKGRECYGNDRMNTMLRLNLKNIEQSTVHRNDHETLTPSQRIEIWAARESFRNKTKYYVRTGGSKVLEQDRQSVKLQEHKQDIERTRERREGKGWQDQRKNQQEGAVQGDAQNTPQEAAQDLGAERIPEATEAQDAPQQAAPDSKTWTEMQKDLNQAGQQQSQGMGLDMGLKREG